MKVKHLVLESLLIATILAALPCAAQQQSTKRLAAQTAQQPAQQAPLTREQAGEFEKKNALPIDKFYDTPDLRKTKPGKLIDFKEFAGYQFPSAYAPALEPKEIGIKTVRFLYHSKSVSGVDVPASGVILIPYGKAPKTGWPVVVWAHGTSGVGRQYAPSLMKDLYYSWEGLLQWAMLGYAVVAPDYAGLGTDVRHQYLTPPAQAQDIIHAVPAAREAVKKLGQKLGEKWIAIGHSQGGAVVVVAEMQMQNKIKDPGYLGAIALAPVGDLVPFLEKIDNTENRFYAAFVAYGIKSVYPEFNYEDFLAPNAAKHMLVVEKGGWLVTHATFAHNVPAGTVLKPDWKKIEHFQKFRKLNMLGEKPAYEPVLLIQGAEDETIPKKSTRELHKRMKEQKSMVEYREYPGLDHDPLVFGSFRDQLRWVQDRFDGKPWVNKKEGK